MLSQGGKLEMVNSVFSSSAIFYTGTIKLHKGVIKQLDKYRKHCLWRGSDLNSKKPSKAAWPMVCLPKKQGGLGVLDLSLHNDAMLLKFMHKFFNKIDIPWVQLIWENYYANGKLPGQNKRGSFWWRDIVKLLDKFKRMAFVSVGDGSTILFWEDSWNGGSLAQNFRELFSFAKNKGITYQRTVNNSDLIHHFNLPLSTQAHQQLMQVQQIILSRPLTSETDTWIYPGETPCFPPRGPTKLWLATEVFTQHFSGFGALSVK
jgi:hypothetical protein